MDRNAARLAIDAQLNDLCAQRDAAGDAATKASLDRAISKLQFASDQIDIAANDAIGAQIETLVVQLQAVQNQSRTDAASALGRTIDRLKGALEGAPR